MYVMFVVQTPPSLIPTQPEYSFRPVGESIIRTFLGAAGSYSFVSFLPLKRVVIKKKEKKEEGSDRSERLIKMIGFNIVLGL
jgi:hypothetical protein